MPEFEKTGYKFPDEQEAEAKVEIEMEAEADEKIEIEIEDDTPAEDRNRKPSEPEFVEALEKDELAEYSEEAQRKIKQFKKVMHDERRAKEAALREQQEALELARRIMEENKKLKERLTTGEQELVNTYKDAALQEVEMAKREYKEAYESGDTDKIVEAQDKLTQARLKVQQADRFVPQQKALQEEENEVKIPQQSYEEPKADPRAERWREANPWFGSDKLMTSLALGAHQQMIEEHGLAYATTDEYYKRIDDTMRKYFPDQFGEEVKEEVKEVKKPSTVVAPATRSTSSKKVRLKQSQLNIIKKLGITPEQYVAQYVKTGGQ